MRICHLRLGQTRILSRLFVPMVVVSGYVLNHPIFQKPSTSRSPLKLWIGSGQAPISSGKANR